MTVGQYLNKTNKDFVKYGRLAKWYGFIGKLFGSRTYMDKAVYYLDKRWAIMMALLDEQK